jgi:Protein of unknown function (Hypoth_ymh)
MRERLITYETLCTDADNSDRARGYNGADPAIIRELRRLEPTIKKILNGLDSNLADFNLEGMTGPLEARGSVQRGLGVLEDQDEWLLRLAPDAPSLPADRLHPWIWDAARTLWESQHYRAAVHRGASAINANLQDKLQRLDVADDKLVQEAFSDKPPEPGKPRLRVPGDPANQTTQSRQRGALYLGLGVFFAIRNPAAHETDEWAEQESLEQLATLSVLARLIDNSTVAK